MRRAFLALVLLFCVTRPVVSLAFPVTYTGTVQAPVLSGTPGIEGLGNWVPASPGDPVTTLSWTVWLDAPGENWHYCYDFDTTAKGGLSHLMIEVSPEFVEDDVVNASAPFELRTYSPDDDGGSSWGLPGDIYGIKFTGNSQTTDQICFESPRAPVWGDFYAKDGKAGGDRNAAWNTGFLDADPLDAPSDGSLAFHILRPDTETGPLEEPVPEPVGLGLIGLALLAARKKRT